MKPTLGSIANADSAVSSEKTERQKEKKSCFVKILLTRCRARVDEDGTDDGAREQRMCEHVDGDPVDDEHDVLN